MKYLNFVMDKDYKIKDQFNVDLFLTDVMGKHENFETNINQDRSGKTVSEDLSASKSDYPVTIITWNEMGEQTLLKTCKTKAGTNCMTAVAS